MIKKLKKYLIYSTIFSILIFIVFSPFLLNNRSLIMNGDGSKQHYIILLNYISYLKNFLNGKVTSTFSWNIGIGADLISQYSYYIIGDFFSYLGLLFDEKYFPYLYSFLIVIRIWATGISMLIYCSYKKISDYKSILMAIIYSSSGFILFAATRQPFFINAVILFPLFIMAIEKLIKENKKVFLTIICFLLIISNFYFCYKMLILGLIYALFYLYKEKMNIKKAIDIFLKALLCFTIAFLLSSPILIPTIYNYLSINPSLRNNNFSNFIYPFAYYKTFIPALTATYTHTWLTIGISSISVILLPIIFRERKKNIALFYSFIAMTIMLLIPFFSSMMNGFSFPSNRWIFGYIFIFIIITFNALRENLIYNSKEIRMMFYTFLIYFQSYLILQKDLKEFIVEFLLGGTIILIFLLQRKYKTKKLAKFLLITVICINMGFNGLYFYSTHGKKYAADFFKYQEINNLYNNLNGELPNLNNIINDLKNYDKDFYRVLRAPNYYQNLSILFNYNSIGSYLSLLNGSSGNFSNDLEYLQRESVNITNNFDNRTIATNILGLKYYIVNNKNINKLPYGYEKILDYGKTFVYRNKYYLSPIIFYDNYISNEEYDRLLPLEKEFSLLETTSIEKNIEKNIDVTKKEGIDTSSIRELSCTISKYDKNNYEQDDNFITISCPKVHKSEIYLNISNIDIITPKHGKSYAYKVNVWQNNYFNSKSVADKYISPYYHNTPLLFNLGYVDNDEIKIKIAMAKKGTYKIGNIKVWQLSLDKYEEKINNLLKNKFKIEDYTNNYIKGNIEVNSSGILQLTTDYSIGWEVYVDGKKTNTFKTNRSFLGIKIDKGKHTIEYKYKTPYQKLSLSLVLIGTILFIGLIIYEKKVRRCSIK